MDITTLRAVLEAEAFAPSAFVAAGPERVGVEAEWIPVDAVTRHVAPIHGAGGTLQLLWRLSEREGWVATSSPKGTPLFLLPQGDTLSFEPGGQVEVALRPEASVSALMTRLARIGTRLESAAQAAGIAMVASGVDPAAVPGATPLMLDAPRYRRMATYLAAIGPDGARMMRQTAALQLSFDWGPPAQRTRRWQVLNAAAPLLGALFANAPRSGGVISGVPSERAGIWRRLDPTRTGLPWGADDPIGQYLRFALDAPAFLLGDDPARAEPFREWLDRGATLDDWRDHLSTLFPEVRPRAYLELRTLDALPLEWTVVPVALVSALLRDAAALEDASFLLGDPDPHELARASAFGLADPFVRARAMALMRVMRAAVDQLDDAVLASADRDTVDRFIERFTERGRAPADDAVAASPEGRPRQAV